MICLPLNKLSDIARENGFYIKVPSLSISEANGHHALKYQAERFYLSRNPFGVQIPAGRTLILRTYTSELLRPIPTSTLLRKSPPAREKPLFESGDYGAPSVVVFDHHVDHSRETHEGVPIEPADGSLVDNNS